MKDLTGQRFGRLVALEPTDKRVDQLVVWRCRCDCGREVEVVGSSLTKGNTRSCGCLHSDKVRRDISGQRFGKLVAVEPTSKRHRGRVVWHCVCDCGNECDVPVDLLTSGKRRSCGCLQGGEGGKSARKDLAGQRFGKLVAVRPAGRKNRYVLWECQCDCGNTKLATTNQLTSGKTTSCGCARKGSRTAAGSPAAKGENLKGMRFGNLVAQRRVGRSGGYAVWECRCECGALVNVKSGALKSGNTRSCGCLKVGGASALAGKRFGKLISIDRTGEGEFENAMWRCLCDCNRVTFAKAGDLTDGATTSCGTCT